MTTTKDEAERINVRMQATLLADRVLQHHGRPFQAIDAVGEIASALLAARAKAFEEAHKAVFDCANANPDVSKVSAHFILMAISAAAKKDAAHD